MTREASLPYLESIANDRLTRRVPLRGPRPIGLFGGTFDPPHRGHLLAAREAIRYCRLDRVVFIPAGDPPHKSARAIAPGPDRWRMVRLAIRGRRRFSASPLELRRRGPSFTYDTVRAMSRRLPGRPLSFIVGADTVAEIPTWHRWRDLLRAARFVVVARPGYRLRPLRGAGDRFDLVRVRGLRISSTRIRATLRHGRPVGRDLTPPVRAYIRRTGLYRR